MILRPPTSLSSVLMPSSLFLPNLYDYEVINTIKTIHENEHNYIKTLYSTFSLPLLYANQSPDEQPQNQKLYLFNIACGIKQELDFILSTVFHKMISTYFIWSHKISCTFQQNFWRYHKWYKKMSIDFHITLYQHSIKHETQMQHQREWGSLSNPLQL